MSQPESSSKAASSATTPALPENVYVFSPADPNATSALLNGRMFTRLSTTSQTEPSKLSAALKNLPQPESFCLSHRNAILIFDSNDDGEDLQDLHHEHFRLVCLALKDADISLEVSKCIMDADNVLQAGFQLDEMSRGSVLVIDLMGEESDDDSDSDSDSDD